MWNNLFINCQQRLTEPQSKRFACIHAIYEARLIFHHTWLSMSKLMMVESWEKIFTTQIIDKWNGSESIRNWMKIRKLKRTKRRQIQC